MSGRAVGEVNGELVDLETRACRTVGRALLAFIERAFLDWRFVFGEFVPDEQVGTTASAMALYVAVAGIWLWALFAANPGSRAGLTTLLVLALLFLAGLGIGTLVSFCPPRCQTAWPLGELSNWAGLDRRTPGRVRRSLPAPVR